MDICWLLDTTNTFLNLNSINMHSSWFKLFILSWYFSKLLWIIADNCLNFSIDSVCFNCCFFSCVHANYAERFVNKTNYCYSWVLKWLLQIWNASFHCESCYDTFSMSFLFCIDEYEPYSLSNSYNDSFYIHNNHLALWKYESFIYDWFNFVFDP